MATLFAMVAQTYYSENYGTPELPHWKCKGDYYHVVEANLTVQDCLNILSGKRKVDATSNLINNSYAQEWLNGTFIVEMKELDPNGRYDPYETSDVFEEKVEQHSTEMVLQDNRQVQAWWEGENNFRRAA